MSENGRGTLNDFANSLIARVVFYYVGLAATIAAVWAVLTQSARGAVMGVLSPLVAFRPAELVGVSSTRAECRCRTTLRRRSSH